MANYRNRNSLLDSLQMLELVSAPSETPVTLTEVKQHCRIDTDDDDSLLTTYLEAAVSMLDGVNGYLNKALVTQRWAYTVRSPYNGQILLPLLPAIDLVSITYYDTDNVQQTATLSDFGLYTDGYEAIVQPLTNIEWFSTYERPDAITITYDAGFGAAADVPPVLKLAIKHLISSWYENREVIGSDKLQELPFSVTNLINPYVKGWVA